MVPTKEKSEGDQKHLEFSRLEEELQQLAEAQRLTSNPGKIKPVRKQEQREVENTIDDDIGSYGRNSGRGQRREKFYKFKRSDSGTKLDELINKTKER